MRLITHFNKLIRNRVLWGVFAVLISASFVLVGFASRGCDSNERTASGVGTLFGEEVRHAELQRALYFEGRSMDRANMTPEEEKQLRRRAWTRVAALRLARQLGIAVSEQQLLQIIQGNRAFQVNGVFNPDAYKQFVASRIGISPGTYEEYLRQSVVLQVLANSLSAVVWAAPSEVDRWLSDQSDLFTLEIATVPQDSLGPTNVTVEAKDIERYYESHSEDFRTVEKVSVSYVEFPVSNFLSNVEINEDSVELYYTNNLADYSETDTNGVTTTEPFTNVAADIRNELQNREAQFLARDQATEFAIALARDRFGNVKTPAQACEVFKVAMQTTEYFSASELLTNLNVSYSFNEAAFALEDTTDAYFSDAILGETAAFVVMTNSRVEPYIPELEAIREDVAKAAEAQERENAFTEAASAVREAILEAMATGTAFRVAAEAAGLPVTNTPPFSVSGGGLPENLPFGLAEKLGTMTQGDLSEAFDAPDGMVIVYCAGRSMGDLAAAAALRPQIIEALDQFSLGAMLEEWSDYLLDYAGFEDFQAPEEEPADEIPAPEEGPTDEIPAPEEVNESTL